jgi:hypothetical protein
MSAVVPPWPPAANRTLVMLAQRGPGNDMRHVLVDRPMACAAKPAQASPCLRKRATSDEEGSSPCCS